MQGELATVLMFGAMLLLFALGVPIVWALGIAALGGGLLLWGSNSLFLLITTTYQAMMNEAYIAIPLFVFMGVILQRSGLADGLFEAIHAWSGPVKGGLAMASVIVCMIFAAMTGLSAAACVTMGLIATPAMLKRGYSKELAVGSVVAPATLGILIPPSVYMILLGVIGRVSVGKLFIGGIGPGLLMTVLFITYIGINGLIRPHTCPPAREPYSLKQKLILTKELIPPIIVIIMVLGSIFAGIATPSESAAVGAAAMVLVVFLRREFSFKLMWDSTLETFRISIFNIWIIFTAMTFSSIYIGLGGVEVISGLLVREGMSSWVSFALLMSTIFVLGMFIDPFAIVWIVAPLSFPIIKALGFNPVWYGVIFVINICTSYITPPFGANLFFMKAIAPPGVSTQDIYRSIWPFLSVQIFTILLCVLFPQIVMWLPSVM